MPHRFVVLGLAALTLLAVAPTAHAAQKVVGYSTSWSGDAAAVPIGRLTHVNYAFVVPFPDGTVEPMPNPEKLTVLVAAAHEAGRKVLISVGGWNDGNDSGFETLAASEGTRANFVAQMQSVVDVYGLDGVDIDWEYPDASGPSGENFSNLMRELCGALHSRGKLCTAAVAGDAYGGSGIHDDVFGYVDYLNLMAYDGGDGPGHSPYDYAVRVLDYWLGRGLPRDKAVLGVPFYGRPSWEGYAEIVARDPTAPSKDISNGVYYNGLDTIRAKASLAQERGGGIMIWELSQDTADDETSLLNALWSVIGPATID